MEQLTKATRASFVPATDGTLSGLKTVIGVILIAAAHSIDALNDVALMLPDLAFIETARAVLEQLTYFGEQALEILGSGFLGFGLVDKARKFLKGIFG